MRRDERIHEGLEVGAPPLREGVADLPLVVDTFARELRAYRRKALVQPRLEALDLLNVGCQVITGSIRISFCSRRIRILDAQFEESISDL